MLPLYWLVGCGSPPSETPPEATVALSRFEEPAPAPWSAEIPRVVRLHAGERTTCLEQSTGNLRCFGALSVGGPAPQGPIRVTDRAVCTWEGGTERCLQAGGRVRVRPTPFVEVQSGGALCGRDQDGQVWCWTSREPEEGGRVIPIPLDGAATALANAGLDTCVLTDRGEVQCFDAVRYVFGFGRKARLAGKGARLLRGTYLQRCWADAVGVRCHREGRAWRATRSADARMLAVGLQHGCVVGPQEVSCWGRNQYGQRDAPPLDPDLVLDLAAGDYHTCALVFGGSVRCWGRDDAKQVSGPCEAGLCE